MKYNFDLYNNLDLYPYNMTLNITNNCNLGCRYCYVYQEPTYMPLSIAFASVDFIANNLFKHKYEIKDIAEDQKSLLVFFGGEPLLQFNEIIVPTVKYCNEKYPNQFAFNMTTNGTLLTEEKCIFLAQNNFDLMISFDGIKNIQDINRPHHSKALSSYDLIIDNLPIILKYLPGVYPRATVNFDQIDYLYQNYIFFEQLGFSGCDFAPEYFTILDRNSKNIKKLQEQVHKIYLHRRLQYKQNIQPIDFQISDWCMKLIFKKDLLHLLNINNSYEPIYINTYCGFGLNEICIDYKGDFYPCREECVAYKENSNCPTIIGNIQTGIDLITLTKIRNKIANIENNFLQSQQCNNKQCFFYQQNLPCQYMSCPAHTLRQNNVNNSICIFLECFFKEALESMSILVEEKNPLFFYYLNSFKDYQLINEILAAPNEQTQKFIIQQILKNQDILSFKSLQYNNGEQRKI